MRPRTSWRRPTNNSPDARHRNLVGPNTAFVVLILGLLGIYAELVWPGRVIPGVLGLGSAVAGAFFLFREPLSLPGVALLAVAAGLLAAEALWGPYFLLGSSGAIALAAGFSLLLPEPRRIAPGLCIPLTLVFGAVTTSLAAAAKKARRNKRADIPLRK